MYGTIATEISQVTQDRKTYSRPHERIDLRSLTDVSTVHMFPDSFLHMVHFTAFLIMYDGHHRHTAYSRSGGKGNGKKIAVGGSCITGEVYEVQACTTRKEWRMS